MKYGEKNIKEYKLMPGIWDRTGIGMTLLKIEFWSYQYDFSFQCWGPGNNNVYINRSKNETSIELTSSGGFETISEMFEWVLKWCEKSNPGIKYPEAIIGSKIDLPHAAVLAWIPVTPETMPQSNDTSTIQFYTQGIILHGVFYDAYFTTYDEGGTSFYTQEQVSHYRYLDTTPPKQQLS